MKENVGSRDKDLSKGKMNEVERKRAEVYRGKAWGMEDAEE